MKTNKRSVEIVRWGGGGGWGGEGGVWWGNPVCCSLWDFFVALPCPLLKMLHTLVKHTQFLHRTAVAIYSEGEEEKEEKSAQMKEVLKPHLWSSQNQLLLLFFLPMSASWLCCKVNPRLCSCSELFPRLLRTFCPPGALQIWSTRLHLGQGFLQQSHSTCYSTMISECLIPVCKRLIKLPWNFLSRIICDNFLSTSPWIEKSKHEQTAHFKRCRRCFQCSRQTWENWVSPLTVWLDPICVLSVNRREEIFIIRVETQSWIVQ